MGEQILGYSVQQTSDGGYIIVGVTNESWGSGDSDVYLIKQMEVVQNNIRTFGGTNSDDA